MELLRHIYLMFLIASCLSMSITVFATLKAERISSDEDRRTIFKRRSRNSQKSIK